ncbi:cysteine protease ATG4-like isoform X1 [Chenopodium quinoa]|uniref:cysteine protease ATG4-like isoform X1 n=1 Tax=Chenopodium quinoa TaxID=63459 RepID=UPI000B7937D0|nr:cysteine protease ATG4-like isoform X1 [Chenopodium quinoa]
MKNLFERTGTANSTSGTSSSSNSPKFNCISSNSSDHKSSSSSSSSTKASSLLSGIVVSAFSIFEPRVEEGVNPSSNLSLSSSSSREKKGVGTKTKISTSCSGSNGWAAAVKRVMASGSMRRIRESMFGFNKSSAVTSTSDIWLLGVCYKLDDAIGGDPVSSSGFAAFVEDFSSRILMTYRKGFDAIGDSKYTSDVNWGCMLRSSQMLVAQVLLVHRFGRSWRKSVNKQIDQGYIEILHDFGDSEESAFSIHKILEAGKGYGLAAGSWIGPYATCRAWETLARTGKSLPMAVYIVSGDEDGERGGAPVVCVEDVSGCCREHSCDGADWTAILLLVPLVLGLDKLNPSRYVPLLGATFTFPQSLGILGGKPGVSTYIVGVQDENVFYLDPHDVQQVTNITKTDLEADTSSFHSNVIRHIPLESIDPSLAIGFYCRDKDDFDDFCSRASKLANESNGAPLFTVTQSRNSPKTASQHDIGASENRVDDSYDMLHSNDGQEDDWQLL